MTNDLKGNKQLCRALLDNSPGVRTDRNQGVLESIIPSPKASASSKTPSTVKRIRKLQTHSKGFHCVITRSTFCLQHPTVIVLLFYVSEDFWYSYVQRDNMKLLFIILRASQSCISQRWSVQSVIDEICSILTATTSAIGRNIAPFNGHLRQTQRTANPNLRNLRTCITREHRSRHLINQAQSSSQSANVTAYPEHAKSRKTDTTCHTSESLSRSCSGTCHHRCNFFSPEAQLQIKVTWGKLEEELHTDETTNTDRHAHLIRPKVWTRKIIRAGRDERCKKELMFPHTSGVHGQPHEGRQLRRALLDNSPAVSAKRNQDVLESIISSAYETWLMMKMRHMHSSDQRAAKCYPR